MILKRAALKIPPKNLLLFCFSGSMMFQYFVKIVPTTYVKLNEEVSVEVYVAQKKTT